MGSTEYRNPRTLSSVLASLLSATHALRVPHPTCLTLFPSLPLSQAVKASDLGQVDLEKEMEKRKERLHVPNWFSVDVKTGVSWRLLPLRKEPSLTSMCSACD